MTEREGQLDRLVADWLASEVAPEIAELADEVRKRHPDGVKAILAYGSCLRGIPTTQSLIDLYVLTHSEQDVSSNWLSRKLCSKVPPNVYYAECEVDGQTYRAKYACLPFSQFARKVSARNDNPYFWARFSQPSALVWADSDDTRAEAGAALTTAIVTMMIRCVDLAPKGATALEAWQCGLQATYGTELRSEGPDRARQIVEANRATYEAVSAALLGTDWTKADERDPDIDADWARRKRRGRLLSVARLIKAAFTFQGGADYLAWKIERHSGVPVNLKPWQRRHPIIASLFLLPKLLRTGAVK